MKPLIVTIIAAFTFAVGGIGGYFLGIQQSKLSLLANPYSDQLVPAHLELATAMRKLQEGDTNVARNIQNAQMHLQASEEWMRDFIGLEHSYIEPRTRDQP